MVGGYLWCKRKNQKHTKHEIEHIWSVPSSANMSTKCYFNLYCKKDLALILLLTFLMLRFSLSFALFVAFSVPPVSKTFWIRTLLSISNYYVCRVSSGVIIIIIGIIARWLDLHAGGRKYWLSICNCKLKSSKFSSLFYLQVHVITSLPFSLEAYLCMTEKSANFLFLCIIRLFWLLYLLSWCIYQLFTELKSESCLLRTNW